MEQFETASMGQWASLLCELNHCSIFKVLGGLGIAGLCYVSHSAGELSSWKLTYKVVCICFYRITLHPLARFRGPLFSKITDWSIVAQAASGDRHIMTWKEHVKYGKQGSFNKPPSLRCYVLSHGIGSIVRIGPNTLSFNTASALKTIYGSRQANVQKADWYRTIDAGSKAFSVHSEIDRSKHTFRRRVIDQAFSERALAGAEGLILEHAQSWIECLGADTSESGWTPPRDMNDWCNWLSFDMMGDMTFGRDFGCVTKGEHRFVPGVVLNATKFVYVVR